MLNNNKYRVCVRRATGDDFIEVFATDCHDSALLVQSVISLALTALVVYSEVGVIETEEKKTQGAAKCQN